MTALDAHDAWTVDDAPEPIHDQAGVERWLRRRRRVLQDAADVEAVRQVEQARLDAWHADRTEGIDRALAYIDRQLDGWMRGHVAAGGSKTVTLPSGTLKARAQQPEWRYTDPDAFLAWAQEHRPELVNEPEPPAPKPDKAAAKKVLVVGDGDTGDVVPVYVEVSDIDEDTGEIVTVRVPVPGVEVEYRDVKVTPEVDL